MVQSNYLGDKMAVECNGDIFKIIQDYSRLLKIIQDYSRLFKIVNCSDCQILLILV